MTDQDQPSTFQLAVLAGLQNKPQYQGLTEDQWARVARRRLKNRVARKQRKLNRRNES